MTNDKIVVAVEKLAEAVRRYGLKSQQKNNLQDVSRDIKTLPYDITDYLTENLELPKKLSVRPRALTPYVEMAVRGSDAAETFYEDRARKSGRGNHIFDRNPRQLPQRMTHLEREGTRDDW